MQSNDQVDTESEKLLAKTSEHNAPHKSIDNLKTNSPKKNKSSLSKLFVSSKSLKPHPSSPSLKSLYTATSPSVVNNTEPNTDYFNTKKALPSTQSKLDKQFNDIARSATTPVGTTNITPQEEKALKLEDIPWLDPARNSIAKNHRSPEPDGLEKKTATGSLSTNSSESSLKKEASSSLGKNNEADSVGGFSSGEAVSKKRNIEFHQLFPLVALDEFLVNDWICSLKKEILVSGRMYATNKSICFYSNLLGWVNSLYIPFKDIISIEKKTTAYVIHNAVQISTIDKKYFFTSFLFRDTVYLVLYKLWEEICPNRSSLKSSAQTNTKKEPQDSEGDEPKNVFCDCYDKNLSKHKNNVHLDHIFETNIEVLFDLMFNTSGNNKNELILKKLEKESCSEVTIGKYEQVEDGPLTRKTEFIKKLTNPLGPKQTKCVIKDELLSQDYEGVCKIRSVVSTPDVPSGSCFNVNINYCFMLHRTKLVRLIISSSIQWHKSSWIKGPIESAVKEGNDKSAELIELLVKEYLQDHPEFFIKDVKLEQTEDKPSLEDAKEDKDKSSIVSMFFSLRSSLFEKIMPSATEGRRITLSNVFTMIFYLTITIMIGINLMNWVKIHNLKSKIYSFSTYQHNTEKNGSPYYSTSSLYGESEAVATPTNMPLGLKEQQTSSLSNHPMMNEAITEILAKINTNLEDIKMELAKINTHDNIK